MTLLPDATGTMQAAHCAPSLHPLHDPLTRSGGDVTFALLSALAFAAPLVRAPQVPDTANLITTLGRDTIAWESYRRTATALEGDIVLASPRLIRYHYTVDFDGAGNVSRSVTDLSVPGANIARRRTTITFHGDSVRVDIDTGGVLSTTRLPIHPGTMPELTTGFGSDYGLYISFGFYQALAAALHAPIGTITPMPVIGAMNGKLATKRLVRRSASDVDVDYFNVAWTHLATDGSGHVTSADASETTEKTHSARIASLDIDSVVKVLEHRQKSPDLAGILSPPDSASAHVGSATIDVHYNSPRKRGRAILGTTVPWNQVWRTGADAATLLSIGGPITVGGKSLPAGVYTLWTIPTPTGATLIVNAQHGQWGTDYDSTQDVIRVPMQVVRGRPVQEGFSIGITTHGKSGELRMVWDDFVWTVALSAP